MACHRPRPLALALLLCLAWPALARAWSANIHAAIAQAAEDRLDARTKAKLRALLGDTAHLADIADCADRVRQKARPGAGDDSLVDCGGVFRCRRAPSTAPWHFINLPVGDSAMDTAKLGRLAPAESAVVGQVRLQAAALARRDSGLDARRLALMYLVHFAGDIHQPLHCADDRDRGGNGKHVGYLSRRDTLSLHRLWDYGVDDSAGDAALSPRALARILERGLRRRRKGGWDAGDPAVWALESYRIARDSIYPAYASERKFVGLNGALYELYGEDYVRRFRPLARLQMEKAAWRLARLLRENL